MKRLFALTLLFATTAHAEVPAILFGENNLSSPLATNKPITVNGPLVQLKTSGGTTLSLQQGTTFTVTPQGEITLASGNLRVGPAGGDSVKLNIPAGPVTAAPLTALSITVTNAQASGRVYQGQLATPTRTFSTGEGFTLTASGAHGTYTPAPAEAPTLTQLASIEPAAGETTPQPEQPTTQQPEPEAPTPEQPTTQQPEPEDPTPPITEEPVTQEPEPETPTPEQPTTPEPQPEPEPEITPEEPAAEVPTTIQRTNLLASFTGTPEGLMLPDNYNGTPGLFTLAEYADGTQQLEKTLSTRFAVGSTLFQRNDAQQLDVASHGSTSGLGRWVGGTLIAVTTATNGATSVVPVENPNSLHYVWGEKPTLIPTSGQLTYNLFSATAPTYTGADAPSDSGTFNGTLNVNFKPGTNGIVGSYNFAGTVTMPEVTQTETGPVTNQITYNIATNPNGVALSGKTFNSVGELTVTAPTGAIACPNGCTGAVNAAGFGAGMKDVGTLYTINATGNTGIAGAALFTAP